MLVAHRRDVIPQLFLSAWLALLVCAARQGGNDVAYDANSVKDNACRPAMSNGSASDQFRSVSPCVLSRTASLHPDVGPSEANRAGRGVALAPFRVRDSEPWALTPLRGIHSHLVAKREPVTARPEVAGEPSGP